MLKQPHRLVKNSDFTRVLHKGRYTSTQFFLLKYFPNNQPQSRFGFVISAKVSKKAVERNLLKRRLREIIKHNLKTIKDGYDVVFLAKKNAIQLTFAQLQNEVLKMLRGLLND